MKARLCACGLHLAIPWADAVNRASTLRQRTCVPMACSLQSLWPDPASCFFLSPHSLQKHLFASGLQPAKPVLYVPLPCESALVCLCPAACHSCGRMLPLMPSCGRSLPLWTQTCERPPLMPLPLSLSLCTVYQANSLEAFSSSCTILVARHSRGRCNLPSVRARLRALGLQPAICVGGC